MEEPQAQPQPGGPEQAGAFLPLGQLGVVVVAGAVFCLLATIVFVTLAVGVFSDRFVTIDDQAILVLRALAGPIGDPIMLLFTTLGDSWVLAVFLGLAALALLRVGRWIDAAGLVLAGAGAGVLNQLLKVSYGRVRPELIPRSVDASGYSFPSGHAMGAIACYGILAFVAWRVLRSRFDRGLLLIETIVLVFYIGLSRVYFGVHFPTDVIGGFVAGAIWLVVCMIAVRAAEWTAERRSWGRQLARRGRR